MTALLEILKATIARSVALGLGWVIAVLGLHVDPAKVDSASSWVSFVSIVGGGVLFERYWPKVKAWFKSNPTPPPVLILLGLGLILAGCGPMTPADRYKHDARIYDGSAIIYSGAVLAGKVPGPAQEKANKVFAAAYQKLTDGRKWLADNPTLANVPGMYSPAMDALEVILDQLKGSVGAFVLPVPLVPLDPPATQPASTQPVPLPIPG